MFYRHGYGSIKESLDWNEKAKVRILLSKEEYQYILKELVELSKDIHGLIKFTNEKLNK